MSTAAAVSPAILALVILDASALTVVPLSVTVGPFITIVLPFTNVGLAVVPAIVGQDVCQLVLPTRTQALLRLL